MHRVIHHLILTDIDPLAQSVVSCKLAYRLARIVLAIRGRLGLKTYPTNDWCVI